MNATVTASIVTGVFSVTGVGLSGLAARWSHRAQHIGANNARELANVGKRLDNRQDKMIHTAIKEYVRDNPGIIDEAVAHEAMRDLLGELIGLHLTPEETDEIQRHHGRRRLHE